MLNIVTLQIGEACREGELRYHISGYFTNWLPFSISRIYISRMAAIANIFLILTQYFKILHFMN